MLSSDLVRVALRQVYRNKRRYNGVLLGISLGLAGLVTVLTVGDSVETDLGRNLVLRSRNKSGNELLGHPSRKSIRYLLLPLELEERNTSLLSQAICLVKPLFSISIPCLPILFTDTTDYPADLTSTELRRIKCASRKR